MTTPSLRPLGIIALLAYGPYVLIHALCIAGIGWRISGVELFMLVPMLAFVAFLAALPALAFRTSRPKALRAITIAGGLCVFFVPTVVLANKLRMLGFELAAERAKPLVLAIRAYEKEHGAPPARPDQLVPRYLPAMPERIPELELITGDASRTRYAGNPWVLVAHVSTGIINWDLFLYFPDQKYPEVGYGGGLERVSDWAYVHE